MTGAIGGAGSAAGGAAGIRDIIALRQQIIDRSQLLQQIHSPTTAPTQPADGAATGFSGALENALHKVSASQDQAEQITDQWQRGEVTDVSKVMLAREQAGVAFEATLQVKSRLLNAYQDIMRMGV